MAARKKSQTLSPAQGKKAKVTPKPARDDVAVATGQLAPVGDKQAKQSKEQKISKALDLISHGSSVREACELVKMPISTFLKYVDSEQYARARDAQADAHFNEMAELEQRCLNGGKAGLDPQTLRAVVDSRKWRLARMRPSVYGDKMALEHSSPNSDKVEHNHTVTPAIQELLNKLGSNNG